jgi:HSP20 family molecular chaperone IbpA
MAELLQQPAIAHEWPCAEIDKTATKYEVGVETPGFGPEDLEIETEGHTLMVFGKPEHGHEGAAFSFTFDLPANADLERLHAEFIDGVLTVTAPLRPRTGKRTLEIETPHLVHAEASGG